MRSSRKGGASSGVTKNKPGGLTRGTPKERMRPVSENKVISLRKRAEDEEKPFFAPGRSAQAIAGRDRKRGHRRSFNSTRIDVMRMASGWLCAMGICQSRRSSAELGPLKCISRGLEHRDGGRFSSAILPRFMRRTLERRRIDSGVVSGRESRLRDFSEALAVLSKLITRHGASAT